MVNILCVGDVVGSSGCEFLRERLPALKKLKGIDLCIVNGENSADGNAAEGGIYTEVYQGQMVPTFNDWCFDASRQPGDSGIVETDYGYHIMYFVGQSTPYWKVQVRDNLTNTEMNEWYMGFTQDHTIEKNDSGMKYVG